MHVAPSFNVVAGSFKTGGVCGCSILHRIEYVVWFMLSGLLLGY